MKENEKEGEVNEGGQMKEVRKRTRRKEGKGNTRINKRNEGERKE